MPTDPLGPNPAPVDPILAAAEAEASRAGGHTHGHTHEPTEPRTPRGRYNVNWKNLGLVAVGLGLAAAAYAFWPFSKKDPNLYDLAGRDCFVYGAVRLDRGANIVTGAHTGQDDALSLYIGEWKDKEKIEAALKAETLQERVVELQDLEAKGLLTQIVVQAPLSQREFWSAADNLANGQKYPVVRLSRNELRQATMGIYLEDWDRDGNREVMVTNDRGLYFKIGHEWEQIPAGSNKYKRVQVGDAPELLPESDAEAVRQTERDKVLEEGSRALGWFRDGVWQDVGTARSVFRQNVLGETKQAADAVVEAAKQDYQRAAEVWRGSK